MHVIILHNAVSDQPTADEADVLVQASAVQDALRTLGHEVSRLPCSLNLEALNQALAEARLDIVFNLVEALGGSDRLMSFVPALLDTLSIPYTGAPAEALLLTGSKLLTKERLATAGIPTPAWTVPGVLSELTPPYIIKAVWEHASFALDDNAVVPVGDTRPVQERLREWTSLHGRPCFAERYIEGREFNLSLLAGQQGPEVLPPAEIDFSAFPPGKPHLVGYQAKWTADSFEYQHTPRTFDFAASDSPLVDKLKALAIDCWQRFGLRGHVRVDFRIDHEGQPWVLEINANPCLSPDAGFAAALERAGISFAEAIQRILADATEKR
jgi:D-alanine-D-alanine ligase